MTHIQTDVVIDENRKLGIVVLNYPTLSMK